MESHRTIEGKSADEWFKLGIKAMEPEEQINCYNKALELNPRNEKVLHKKSYVLYKLGRYEDAVKCCKKELEINPENEIGWYNKGCALYKLEQYEGAIECYDKALKLNIKNEKALLDKGKALCKLEKYEEAIKWYDEALKINPKNKKALGNKGWILERIGKYEETAECDDKAIELTIEESPIHRYLGILIECDDKAIELTTEDEITKNNNGYPIFKHDNEKGKVLEDLRRYEASVECDDKAIELIIEDEITKNYNGYAIFKHDRYRFSNNHYDKILETNPRDTIAWYEKGKVLEDLGKYEEAIKCYDGLLNINSRNKIAWHEKGNILDKLGRFEEANKCYDEASDINWKLWHLKGLYDKALKIKPKNVNIWHDKADAFVKMNGFDDAIECYNKIIEISPENKFAWDSKVSLLCKLERYEALNECYDKLLGIHPEDVFAWQYKGETLCKLGKYEDAIKCYDKALKIDPKKTHILKLRKLAISNLEDLKKGIVNSKFRTCFHLEPPTLGGGFMSGQWSLRYFIQALDDLSLIVPAEKVWRESKDTLKFLNRRFDNPNQKLLADLKEAAKLYDPINESLYSTTPTEVKLTTQQAYRFLKEVAPLLMEKGFGVPIHPWWNKSTVKSTLNIKFKPDSTIKGRFCHDSIIKYDWKIAVGGEPITEEDFKQTVSLKISFVRVQGQWVEIKLEEFEKALQFLETRKQGEMKLSEALRLISMPGEFSEKGLLINVSEDSAGITSLIDRLSSKTEIPNLSQPCGLCGQLYPYQVEGFSWLAYMKQHVSGVCLADDMGLGKTIQMLALLLKEKEEGTNEPSLLICPTSVIPIWKDEAKRFAPSLRIHVHHGIKRENKKEFLSKAKKHDLVITTYTLAYNDEDIFKEMEWNSLILDEAHNIKNPYTKQSQAVRKFKANFHVALTGTPVQNRLSELRSIMDFLMPGCLGSANDFHKNFALPIERDKNKEIENRLKRIIQPFILRRRKTDSEIKAGLPKIFEQKEYCNLTLEQATLYEAAVKDMLQEIEDSECIKKKGMVLSLIRKLKKLCNHPAHYRGDGSALPERSGKLNRITEMLDEVLAEDDSALVFTQFAEMGKLLMMHFSNIFGQEKVLFFHGRLSPYAREEMVNHFNQTNSPQIFIISVKAGGEGLNLTRASHVFHFDRWWSYAVENQATSRAHRKGQIKNVQVHKFICIGTLEEKIDELIEYKKALGENIIGIEENWLTEATTKMTTEELRELFELRRNEAILDD
ncbi:MAG: SNF2-related protein [Candidatus Methanoperedens sp.]